MLALRQWEGGSSLASRSETQYQTDTLENPELKFLPVNAPTFIARLASDRFACKPRMWTWRCTVKHIIGFAITLLFLSLSFFLKQKLQTFQSLSCPGISIADTCQSSLPPLSSRTPTQPDLDITAVSDVGLASRQEVTRDDEEEDSSYEELDSDSACSVDSRPGSPVGVMGGKRTLWKGDCGTQRDIFQLGGELDLDQIERNWTLSRRFKSGLL